MGGTFSGPRDRGRLDDPARSFSILRFAELLETDELSLAVAAAALNFAAGGFVV